MIRTCTKCGEGKLESEEYFYRNNRRDKKTGRTYYGWQSRCKICMLEASKAWSKAKWHQDASWRSSKLNAIRDYDSKRRGPKRNSRRKHSHGRMFTDGQVHRIRNAYADGRTIALLAGDWSCCRSTIAGIVYNQTYKHVETQQ